jgi:maltooligosyltrehalose trehalohydrolase
MWTLDIGASIIGKGMVRFRVWAPLMENVSVRILSCLDADGIELQRDQWGYFEGVAEGVDEGERYLYLLDRDIARPDPASRFQPDGVHGPSQIVDPRRFRWEDDGWTGIPLKEFIIYELHVGTFTKMGSFESIIEHLDYLKDLGITAIELMPVAQFPGGRNWGYDGVYPFAPQNSYGGPPGLKTLINECHKKGLGLILDVVYNHLGPEGNYLGSFAPYFVDRYKTPWGDAINFDGPYSDQVRNYFVSNALYWMTEYHVDALRIDAVQGIFDFSAHHFLKELADAVHSLRGVLGRHIYLIAESDLNDARVIDPTEINGFGFDAQWNDDFHHALHAMITGETGAYYQDFGTLDHMAKALSEGFVYSGQYSSHRKRRHGNSSKERPAHQLIVFSQNHDQVGNRPGRPGRTQSLEQLKLAAAVVLLSPYLPLLFMGEEYAEKAPFHYFVDFSDHALGEAVRKGRRAEFARFGWSSEAPDPQAETAFLDSKIEIHGPRSIEQEQLYHFYRALIRLRKETPTLANPAKEQMELKPFEHQRSLFVRRWFGAENLFCLYNFGGANAAATFMLPEGRWAKVLDSSSEQWGGHGENTPESLDSDGFELSIDLDPYSFVLYRTVES